MNQNSVFVVSTAIGSIVSALFFEGWEGGLAIGFVVALVYGVFFEKN